MVQPRTTRALEVCLCRGIRKRGLEARNVFLRRFGLAPLWKRPQDMDPVDLQSMRTCGRLG